MTFLNYLSEKIILPGSDLLLDKSVSKNLKFLMESQWWEKEQLEEYQNTKLRKLIKHSYENIPYYKELFSRLNLTPEDIKTKNDIYKIPVLTKDDIRKNLSNGKIIARNISKKDLILNSSSGSTGEPLQFYETKKSHSMWNAAGIRGWYWMGYKLGDKYIKISQNPRSSIIKKAQDLINRSLYLYCRQLTDENFKGIINSINQYQPSFIRFYPDLGLFLANYIKNNNLTVHAPIAITTTGNKLFDSTRHIIEEVFNCEVFDSYSSEGSAVSAECSTHNCYHTSMEYNITEILNDGSEVKGGEKGRVITTDLFNYANPSIRYDTQDYITKSKYKCTCGRNLTAVESIDGRDSDILISPGGKLLIVHHFTVFFEWIDSVEQFQIRQNSSDEFNFLLKVNSKYNQEAEKNIYRYWYDYIGGKIKITINVVDDIPLTKSGKRRFLIRSQDVKLPFRF